jgi:hypothetical protein
VVTNGKNDQQRSAIYIQQSNGYHMHRDSPRAKAFSLARRFCLTTEMEGNDRLCNETGESFNGDFLTAYF